MARELWLGSTFVEKVFSRSPSGRSHCERRLRLQLLHNNRGVLVRQPERGRQASCLASRSRDQHPSLFWLARLRL
jgi:hypothetical protein